LHHYKNEEKTGGPTVKEVGTGPADPAAAGPIICDKQEFSGNKISKFGATRCQILRIKCTAQTPLESLQCSPDPSCI